MDEPQQTSKRPSPKPAVPIRVVIAAVFGGCAVGLISETLHRRGGHEPMVTNIEPKPDATPDDRAVLDSTRNEVADED